MIDAIGGGSGGFNIPENKLTDDQKELVTSTLAEYDIESLSSEDAKNIADIFKDAGIKPGQDLKNVLSDAGIDVKELAQKAGFDPANRPPGFPSPEAADLPGSFQPPSDLNSTFSVKA